MGSVRKPYELVRSPARNSWLGQGYESELLYDGEGKDGGRFMMGLADPGAPYDGQRSAPEAKRSPHGRGLVAVGSDSGRPSETPRNPPPAACSSDDGPAESKTPLPRLNGSGASYPRLIGAPHAAQGRDQAEAAGGRHPRSRQPLSPHAAVQPMAVAKNYSKRTVENRKDALRLSIGWAHERGLTRPQGTSRPILERYQRHLFLYRKANGESLSVRSQHVRTTPQRALFKWLAC